MSMNLNFKKLMQDHKTYGERNEVHVGKEQQKAFDKIKAKGERNNYVDEFEFQQADASNDTIGGIVTKDWIVVTCF